MKFSSAALAVVAAPFAAAFNPSNNPESRKMAALQSYLDDIAAQHQGAVPSSYLDSIAGPGASSSSGGGESFGSYYLEHMMEEDIASQQEALQSYLDGITNLDGIAAAAPTTPTQDQAPSSYLDGIGALERSFAAPPAFVPPPQAQEAPPQASGASYLEDIAGPGRQYGGEGMTSYLDGFAPQGRREGGPGMSSYLDFVPPFAQEAPQASSGASYLEDIAGPGRQMGGAGMTSYLDGFAPQGTRQGGPGMASYLDFAQSSPAPVEEAPTAASSGSYLEDIAGPGTVLGGAGIASYLDGIASPSGFLSNNRGGPGMTSYLDTVNLGVVEEVREVVIGQNTKGNKWYPGTVTGTRTINVYTVSYPDGDEDINLPEDALRPQDGVSPLEVGTPVEVLSWEDRFGPFSSE